MLKFLSDSSSDRRRLCSVDDGEIITASKHNSVRLGRRLADGVRACWTLTPSVSQSDHHPLPFPACRTESQTSLGSEGLKVKWGLKGENFFYKCFIYLSPSYHDSTFSELFYLVFESNTWGKGFSVTPAVYLSVCLPVCLIGGK